MGSLFSSSIEETPHVTPETDTNIPPVNSKRHHPPQNKEIPCGLPQGSISTQSRPRLRELIVSVDIFKKPSNITHRIASYITNETMHYACILHLAHEIPTSVGGSSMIMMHFIQDSETWKGRIGFDETISMQKMTTTKGYTHVKTHMAKKTPVRFCELEDHVADAWDKGNYNVYTNNCQHFVDFIVDFCCDVPHATFQLQSITEPLAAVTTRAFVSNVVEETIKTQTTWTFFGEAVARTKPSIIRSTKLGPVQIPCHLPIPFREGFWRNSKELKSAIKNRNWVHLRSKTSTMVPRTEAKWALRTGIGIGILFCTGFLVKDLINFTFRGKCSKKQVLCNFGKNVASTLGSSTGSAIGAYIGTCVFPGVGTFLGSFVGGSLGSMLSQKCCKRFVG